MASLPRVTETTSGAAAGVVTGAVMWALTTYVFTKGVPDPLSAVVWLVIPAFVTGAVGYLTRKTSKLDAPTPTEAK